MLSGGFPGYADAAVTVYDKLTYAGNLANLAPVADKPGYAFVQGDIIECFINNAFAFSCRAYNTRSGRLGLHIFGGKAQVQELSVKTSDLKPTVQ